MTLRNIVPAFGLLALTLLGSACSPESKAKKALEDYEVVFEECKKITEETKTEIGCLARGGYHLFPQAISIIDIGGQDNKVIKVGAPLPAFSLTNMRGAPVSSADLLARGALVLSVFRGHW